MDKERKAKQDFLDSSIDYCDQLEALLLGITNPTGYWEKLDQATCVTHSLKGGAAVIGFRPLSLMAHTLEDYLKILQARYQHQPVDTQIQTRLLQLVDCLHDITHYYQQGNEPSTQWLDERTAKVLSALKQNLGVFTEADEIKLKNIRKQKLNQLLNRSKTHQN